MKKRRQNLGSKQRRSKRKSNGGAESIKDQEERGEIPKENGEWKEEERKNGISEDFERLRSRKGVR